MWLKDEHGKASVSLTLLVVSFVVLVTTGALNAFDLVKTTSIFMELFATTALLYFGRKGQKFGSFKLGAKEISLNPEDKK